MYARGGRKPSTLTVPNALIPNRPGIIAVRMSDDSMSPKIGKGATVFLDTTRTRAKSKEIVAAYVGGCGEIRTLVRVGRTIVLEPFNRHGYNGVTIKDVRHLRILGVYIGHWTGRAPGRQPATAA